jgi:hypothetical protein
MDEGTSPDIIVTEPQGCEQSGNFARSAVSSDGGDSDQQPNKEEQGNGVG